MSADGLCASSWLKGPIFLFTSDFPFQPNNEILGNLKKPLNSPLGDPVQKQESSLASNVSYEEKLFDYTKFSSYFKRVRITAYLLPKHAHFSRSTPISGHQMLQFLGPMNSRLLKQNLSSSFNLNHSRSRKNNFWMKSTLSEKAHSHRIPLSLVPML